MRLCDAQFCRRLPVRRRHCSTSSAHSRARAQRALKAVRRAFPMRAEPDQRARPGGPERAPSCTSRTSTPTRTTVRRVGEAGRLSAASLAVPMLRDGVPIGAIAVRACRGRTVLRPRRSSCSRPSPTRPSSPSRTSACSRSSRRATATSPRRWNSRPRPARSCASSPGSPTDVQPVFDTIARSAKQLCDAEFCVVFRFDGQLLHFVAHHGLTPEGIEATRRAFPMAADRGSAAGRSVLNAAVEHIPDVNADPDYTFGAVARVATFRSIVAVPMLRDGVPIGAITVRRVQEGPFSDRQIDLLKTFADQAVIAIENVRLFQELEARTGDLTRSVGELRALGEVSQAVSSTLDLETVLETIVSRAVQLSGSDGGIVYEFDEATQSFHARATHRVSPEHLEVVRAAPIRLGEGAVGRAGVSREPVQVADIQEEWQLIPPQVRAIHAREGHALPPRGAARPGGAAARWPRHHAARAGRLRSRGGRDPPGLRDPVGPGHPQRRALPGDPAPEAVRGRDRGDEPGGDRDRRPRRPGRGVEPRRRAALRVHGDGGPRPPHGGPRRDAGEPRRGPRQHRPDARGRMDPRHRAPRPEGRHPGGRRDLVGARGRRRRQDGHDRHLPRHHRPPPGPPRGRDGQRGQERLPGDDEPRDPDAR